MKAYAVKNGNGLWYNPHGSNVVKAWSSQFGTWCLLPMKETAEAQIRILITEYKHKREDLSIIEYCVKETGNKYFLRDVDIPFKV